MEEVVPERPEAFESLDAATDAAIAACDGDARAAVRALIVANSYLLEQLDRQRALLEQSVSRGFVRGRLKGKEER